MRLGEILMGRGQLSQDELDRALELQRERGDKLGRILTDLGFVSQRDVLSALSEQLGVAIASLEAPPQMTPETGRLAPRFLRQARALPLRVEGSTLVLAMADPLDFETQMAVRASTGLQIKVEIAPEQEIADALDRHFAELKEEESLAEGRDGEETAADLEHLRDMASEAPVIRLVNVMIGQAVEKRASDIHIEPYEKEIGRASCRERV